MYYGWWIITTLAITEPISWGIVYYGFSVMLPEMQGELGWSRAQITGAFSLALLLSGLAAVPVGRLLDRYGARGVMTAGSIAATLLVIGWSRVYSLWSLYLVWAGLGITMAAILYEPAFAVVTTWFIRRRQRALTILTFGGGLASVIFVPIATALSERYGWRSALLALAIVLAVTTIPLHALVLRRRPRDLGLVPDGHAPSDDPQPRHLSHGVSARSALRGGAFWWLAVAFATSVLATVAINVHLFAFLAERGFSPGFRATATALIGGSQIPGRLIFTPLGARLSIRKVAALLFVMQAVALLLLLAFPVTWGVLLFAVLFGAGSGALTPARAAIVADLYGALHYGSINGVLALLTTIARSIAPVSAGLMYSLTGSYVPLWWTLAALTLGGMAAMLCVRDRPLDALALERGTT